MPEPEKSDEIDPDKIYAEFNPAKPLNLGEAMSGFDLEQFTDTGVVPTDETENVVQKIRKIKPLKKPLKKLSYQLKPKGE